ncbi:MAG: DUF5787 family protein [Haloferacaceae archaeon]
MQAVPEFTFELLVCRWAERTWPPTDRTAVPVVARQLGTADRRWDTVVVETTPEALSARARFGPRTLDADLLHVVRNAPAEWAWYRDALPEPDYPWRYVRAAVHRAAARGVVETRRDGNRVHLRRIAPYPDWVDRIVAIENKPDLSASAARRLVDQITHDVTRGLADEAWVATAATGATVEPALLEAMPVEAGVLTVALDDRERVRGRVAWLPADLDGGEEGTRIELAERAYGRGFRSYVDRMRPDCRSFELRRRGDALVPWCAAKERHQTGGECSGDCGAFAPEPPAWRTRGWPIEGGPGRGIRRLLERRRERARRRGREGTDATDTTTG